jgi:hypothetical protein
MHTRALVAVNTGDAATARPLIKEALELFSRAGDISGVTLLIDDAGQLSALEGDRLRALRLAGASEAIQTRTGTALAALSNGTGGRPVAAATDATETNAWNEGAAMSTDEAVAYALTLGVKEAG